VNVDGTTTQPRGWLSASYTFWNNVNEDV
jgi:hypothetical protein